MREPDFTLGIEEEYLLLNPETYDLADAPEALMDACQQELGDRVSPEFKRCQIEVGTGVCASVSEARDELTILRRTVARHAADHGLVTVAVSCHPNAEWQTLLHTDKERYNTLARDLGGIVERLVTCAMHVHVGIPDDDLRIDLLNQFPYFLPHLHALSGSSPFWEGVDTGLGSYRLSVFDNLPRTGLPPRFDDFHTYESSVNLLVETGIIEDATKIWWDIRPSARFPTLETRICDVMPKLDDAIAVTALIQALMRMLWRLKVQNQRWRIYDRFLVGENRWRAQRYGVSGSLIDLGRRELIPMHQAIEEMIQLTAPDAMALGTERELAHIRHIAQQGTSSDRQRAVWSRAMQDGADKTEAFREVMRTLAAEFAADL